MKYVRDQGHSLWMCVFVICSGFLNLKLFVHTEWWQRGRLSQFNSSGSSLALISQTYAHSYAEPKTQATR